MAQLMPTSTNDHNPSVDAQSFSEQIKESLVSAIPGHLSHLKAELLDYLGPVVEHQLRHAGLVTQAEFDAQKAVLAKTRQLLVNVTKRLDALEQDVASDPD